MTRLCENAKARAGRVKINWLGYLKLTFCTTLAVYVSVVELAKQKPSMISIASI